MPTILSFLSHRQITNDSGVPQSGAKVSHFRANTTTALTVWQDAAGTVPHPQPVPCDAGGFVPLVYVDDTFNWKIVVTTAAGVTLPQYNSDNLPKAESDVSALGFAPPLFPWVQVTSGASPVALTVADVGKAYEADTTGGSIEFDLPSAASVGDGKGFVFKKTATPNSMIIDPFGTETIDDVSTSLTITQQYQTIGIFSNGAEWYAVFDFGLPLITLPTVQRFTSGSGTWTPPAGCRYIRVRMVGPGGGGGARLTNGGQVGTDSVFGAWTAIHGDGGGGNGASALAAGGTGGANGAGTLITRVTGENGSSFLSIDSTFNAGGHGGSSVFGGGGKGLNGAGEAGKANTGSGGSGSGNLGGIPGVGGASGGAAGEYVEFFVSAPVAVSYTVGTGGVGGPAGGNAGGNGAAGVILVEEFY